MDELPKTTPIIESFFYDHRLIQRLAGSYQILLHSLGGRIHLGTHIEYILLGSLQPQYASLGLLELLEIHLRPLSPSH